MNATAETEKTWRIDWIDFHKMQHSFKINAFGYAEAKTKAKQKFNKLRGNIVTICLVD